MKVLGFRRVDIDKLKLEGEFRKRLDQPRVFERAKSVKRIGIISEPGIRNRTNKVIYGRDRIAAAIRAGETTILCKVWECTDEEARELEISENIHRRHDPDKARQDMEAMLEQYEKEVLALAATEPEKIATIAGGNTGGAKTARGLARARVAAELGIKPDSVRRREYRIQNAAIKRRHNARVAEEREAKKAMPEVTTIGMEVEEEFARTTNELRRMLTQAAALAIKVELILSDIKNKGLPFNAGRMSRLYDDAHRLAADLKLSMPVSLCPYCKGLPGVQESCGGCLQTGWIDGSKFEHVPKELWKEGDKMIVAYQGRMVPVAELLETPETPKQSHDSFDDLFA